MRYKKGSIVEVLSKTEVPSGSWCCAEIIFGNGHNYTVRYEMDPHAIHGALVERVPRKSIRPCPPPVELPENLMPGDVLEVFHNLSWKMATVSKILARNHYLVRLIGSSHEFKVSRINLRVRQSWENDQWFIIGTSIGNREEVKHSNLNHNQKLSSQVKITEKRMSFLEDDNCPAENKKNSGPLIIRTKTLKRRLPNCYSQVEAPARSTPKIRVIEKEGRRRQLLAKHPSPLPEKVDAVVSHQGMLGEKHAYTSFNNRTIDFTGVDLERKKPGGAVRSSHFVSLEPNDSDNVTCSVASCSATSNDCFKFNYNFSRGPVEDTEGNDSDAESVYHWGFEEGNIMPPTQEELAAEIHRAEVGGLYPCFQISRGFCGLQLSLGVEQWFILCIKLAANSRPYDETLVRFIFLGAAFFNFGPLLSQKYV
ncbi:hypothetical protein NMG60_11013324 [Bertholletia excelsa]